MRGTSSSARTAPCGTCTSSPRARSNWKSRARPGGLGRGEMFGQMAILTARARRAEVRAIAPSTLLVLDEARFRRLLGRSARCRSRCAPARKKRGIDPRRSFPEPAITPVSTEAQPSRADPDAAAAGNWYGTPYAEGGETTPSFHRMKRPHEAASAAKSGPVSRKRPPEAWSTPYFGGETSSQPTFREGPRQFCTTCHREKKCSAARM